MRILVTGASGFVGRALVEDLAAQGHRVRAAMRQPADIFSRTVEVVAVSDLARPLEWRPLLSDINATDFAFIGRIYPKPGHAVQHEHDVEEWDESEDVEEVVA